jgi:uncharacterized membrane protein (UPF0127 family)
VLSAAVPRQRQEVRTARGVVALILEDGSTVCERCVVANKMFPRMRGLLGRRSLPAGEGLLIRPAPSVHTFFMRFPIDVLFLSRSGQVLKVCADVGPWRARSCRGAYAVVELPAGEAGRRGVAVGDSMETEDLALR